MKWCKIWNMIVIFSSIAFFVVYIFVEENKREKTRIIHELNSRKYAFENHLPPYTKITRIRGCQYLESGSGYSFSRTHMGDCDNPIHHNIK